MKYIALVFLFIYSNNFGMCYDSNTDFAVVRPMKLQDYVLLSDGSGHMRVTFNPADRRTYLTNYTNDGKQSGESKKIVIGHQSIDLYNLKSLGMAPFSAKEVLLVFLASKIKEDDMCVFTIFHREEGYKKNFFLKSEGKIISLLSLLYYEKKFCFKLLEKLEDYYSETEIIINKNFEYTESKPGLLKRYHLLEILT